MVCGDKKPFPRIFLQNDCRFVSRFLFNRKVTLVLLSVAGHFFGELRIFLLFKKRMFFFKVVEGWEKVAVRW